MITFLDLLRVSRLERYSNLEQFAKAELVRQQAFITSELLDLFCFRSAHAERDEYTMDFEDYLDDLQKLINYPFRNRDLLKLALTAAGAEGNDSGTEAERTMYDGNRRLALMGEKLLQTVIVEKKLFEEKSPERSLANDALKSAAAKELREKRAKDFLIHTHMKLNVRQKGHAAKGTLSTAINAIFGACYRDSGDIYIVRRVVECFGLDVSDEAYTSPIEARRLEDLKYCQLTDVVFDQDSQLASRENTIDFMANDLSMTQRPDTNFNEQPSISLDNIGFDEMTPEYEELFEFLGEDSGSRNSERFSDSLSMDQQMEPIRGTEEDSQIAQGRSDSNPEAALGNSLTGIINSEESPTNTQRTLSINNRDSVPVVPENKLKRLRVRGNPANSEGESSAQGPSQSARSGTFEKTKRITTNVSQLDKYVTLQKERCQHLGLPCPEKCFNEVIAFPTPKSRLQNVMQELKVLYFSIASLESIVALRAMIKVGRRNMHGELGVPRWELSSSSRLTAIEHLSEEMSYLGLIRRCHIHQLYEDSSNSSHRTSDGFIIDTAQTLKNRSSSALGNPQNLEDARVLKQIMQEVYPDLEPATPEYNGKLTFAKYLRRLGRRLNFLVELWGYGILGLILFAADVPGVDPALIITENDILKFPDDVFKWFVQRLNQLQGDHLREMSDAASEIVIAISRGTISSSPRFGIEELEQDEILGYPRSSPEIFRSMPKVQSHL